MVKTAQVRRCQGLDNVGRDVSAMRNPQWYFFYSISFKKAVVLFRNEIWLCQKNTNFLFAVWRLSVG